MTLQDRIEREIRLEIKIRVQLLRLRRLADETAAAAEDPLRIIAGIIGHPDLVDDDRCRRRADCRQARATALGPREMRHRS
jgi:hypothetical protein